MAVVDRTVDELVEAWLTLPEVAQRLDLTLPQVRRLLDDRHLMALRRGRPRQLFVPSDLVEPDLLPGLAGTITVLADCGLSDEEAMTWLFTDDGELAGTPAQAMRAGRKTPVRRRAQLLG